MDTNVYTQDVTRFSELPVPDEHRKRTDIFCTICSGLFALVLFIVSCAVFNNQNLVRMTFFVDIMGNVCGYDQPVRDYPLMYFTSLNNATKRLCVSECPKGGDTELACYPTKSLTCYQNKNPNYEVTIYDSATEVNRIGGICRPNDPALADKIDQMSRMESKYTFLTIYDSIWTSLWISLLFGVLLIIMLQCMTRKLIHWMFIVGSLTFIALGLVLIIVPEGFILFKIIGGLAFIFLGALVATTYLNPQYRKEVFISSRLYQVSAAIVKQRPLILLAILIWSILQVGLLALTGFQLLSAWSIGPLVFDPASPFLKTNSFISNFLSFFVFFEFIWGLSFLKESFNFCISGFATNWYCNRDHNQSKLGLLNPVKRLFKFHWGSVVGGSLLLFMFYFFDLVIDFFWSTDTAFAEQGREIKAEPFTRKTLDKRGFRGFFDLIRSQSFGYINLIPIPYCNASRYCEMLADDSTFYDRSQTTNRLYRLSAHIVIMMAATLIALAGNKHTDQHPNIFGVFFVAMVSLFSVTYFISLHADLAEGILISIFLEERLSQFGQETVNGKLDHGKIEQPPEIVNQVYVDDMHDVYSSATILEYLKGHLTERANDNEREHAPNDLF